MTLVAAAGVVLIALILWDAFEAVVLPRRVTRRVRLTVVHFRLLWLVWALALKVVRNPRRRESFLSLYAPLALMLLLATWAAGLIVGFAMVHWGLGANLVAPESHASFATALYFSGTTLFTLGLGDVHPSSPAGRMLTVIEAGTGFALLALAIGYLPVFYQSFARRETDVSMLDEWAGSPPAAGTLLSRLGQWHDVAALSGFLSRWEQWAADPMESHISYPILAGFRSQHGNQSWLSGLTAILDTCALVLVGIDGLAQREAWLTFAISRHALVDLCQVLNTPPVAPAEDRLPDEGLAQLRRLLAESGIHLRGGPDADTRLAELRRMYEPYAFALSRRLLMPLPPWMAPASAKDNWTKSAWV
ncbi:MAG: potassium channel family protein [bacterium]